MERGWGSVGDRAGMEVDPESDINHVVLEWRWTLSLI